VQATTRAQIRLLYLVLDLAKLFSDQLLCPRSKGTEGRAIKQNPISLIVNIPMKK
jgi:hypothetical protein